MSALAVCPDTGLRTWTLLIPAPVKLWSTNDAHQKGPHATSAKRIQWRNAAYVAAQAARLPKGLTRVRLAFTFHFQTRQRRDALNFSETAKPVIDAFGPPYFRAPSEKRSAQSAPGWGLIPDDTPEFLESTSLAIGPLWRDVVGERSPLASKFGGLTVVITDLSAAVS